MLFQPWNNPVSQRSWSNERPATTAGVTVTANATPHSLSSAFTEVIASTSFTTNLVRLHIHTTRVPATATNILLNLYKGAASSEVLWIDSLAAGWSVDVGSNGTAKWYEFPLIVPAGTRISAKSRALIASDTLELKMELLYVPYTWAGVGVQTLGADTANSRGTTVVPGTTSEGSFTNIGTTGGLEWKYVYPMIHGMILDTTGLARTFAMDLGVGGSQKSDLEEMWFETDSGEIIAPVKHNGRYKIIPPSTTLQARLQSNGTAEDCDVLLYGVY